MKLSDFQADIHNFYEIEDEATEKQLLKDILSYANTVGESHFAKEVRMLFPNLPYSDIGVIYEALSENPEKWGNFYVEQYKLTFQEAENANEAFEILDNLEEICFADDTGFGADIIRLLEPYLDHSKPALRYKAIWYMGDWVGTDNKRRYPQIVRKIKERLNDNNWRIRCMTKGILEDMEELPKGYKLSFFDKIRAKYGSIYRL